MGAVRRILITGAGGFVGSWLVRRLAVDLPEGGSIVASGYADGEYVKGLELDVTRASDVDEIVDAVKPDCVIHLAGMSSLGEARVDARKAWEVNLFGTINLADAVLRLSPQARFINAGSSEVYGRSFNRQGGMLDESALLDPCNPYASTKAAADLVLGQMAEAGLRSVRLRLFNHTGPGQSPTFAVPAFASQIAAIERGERPPVMKVGNLDAKRDFLDVRDVVEAYAAVAGAVDLPSGIVINVASGVPRRMGDVLDAMLGMSEVEIDVEQDRTLMRPSDIPVTAGDARRAASLLGWRPSIAWEKTLRDVLDAHRHAA